MTTVVNGIKLECLQGNIAFQKDMTAVVNAANAELSSGGGVAGTFGYPLKEAAVVAWQAVLQATATLQAVQHIRFVLYDAGALQVFETALARLGTTGQAA